MPCSCFFEISNAGAGSMPPGSATRWTRHSGAVMPMAPGTGRAPTTLARRLLSCSCASSVVRWPRAPPRAMPCCRCWRRWRACSRPTRGVRRRARHSRLDLESFRQPPCLADMASPFSRSPYGACTRPRHARPSTSMAAATTRSGSNPNLRCSSLSGADAPKVFMPMMRPSGPT